MCDPVTMLVGAGVSAVGSIQAGQAKKRAAYADAEELDYQARVERDNAEAEAGVIERQGRYARGETLAGFAAMGVKIGEGSALDVERQLMEDVQRDKYMTLLTGERVASSNERQAAAKRRAGRDAATAGLLKGAGTLIGAGYEYSKATRPTALKVG